MYVFTFFMVADDDGVVSERALGYIMSGWLGRIARKCLSLLMHYDDDDEYDVAGVIP